MAKPATDLPAEEHLWEIADEIKQILGIIEEAEGEVTEEVDHEWANWKEAFDKKVERVVKVIRTYERTSESAAIEEKRLKGLRISRKNHADWLRDYLFAQMKRAARDRVDTDLISVALRTASKPSIKWVPTDAMLSDEDGHAIAVEDTIPGAYVRTTRALDGNLAQLAFKAGAIKKDDPGWAIEFKESITIR